MAIEDAPTLTNPGPSLAEPQGNRFLALSILWHPDLSRVGEVASIGPVEANPPVLLSRQQPLFTSALGEPRPLADPFISKSPSLRIQPTPDAVIFDPTSQVSARPTTLQLSGEPLTTPRALPLSELQRGIIITLAHRIVLCLHLASSPDVPLSQGGLVGNSDAMVRLRATVTAVADLDVPVLIRGETGTGKEVTAAAITQLSPRARAPFVAINMGAMAPSTAAAALFGHDKGAFTGATAERPGHFVEAHQGTLFLDEIGLAPREVQAAILRAIETGEVRPLGSRASRRVDVRLIAATDTDLERSSFLPALYHRLSGFEIKLAPLRERRQDIGLLLLHFLRQVLDRTGESSNLAPRPHDRPMWLAGDIVAQAALADWPGNVRQLKNWATQLVVANRGKPVAAPPANDLYGPAAPQVDPTASSRPPRPTDEELLRAMQHNGWKTSAAARELGIPRATLERQIAFHPSLARAADISRAELARRLRGHNGDFAALADDLHISVRALKLRLKARER